MLERLLRDTGVRATNVLPTAAVARSSKVRFQVLLQQNDTNNQGKGRTDTDREKKT